MGGCHCPISILAFKHTSSLGELADSYLKYLFFSLGLFDSSGNLVVGCKLFVLVTNGEAWFK